MGGFPARSHVISGLSVMSPLHLSIVDVRAEELEANNSENKGGSWAGENGPVLHFVEGIPGFPSARHFVVVPLPPDLEPFCRIRCLDVSGLEFVVVPPGLLFDNYKVEVEDEEVERLGLTTEEDAVVLVIVTLARLPAVPTVNLLGPLVINKRTMTAAQVIQHTSGYGVSVPIPMSSVESAL